MVKNYGIHDEWKDLNKVNDIDIKSIDGVIDSIKVNGEEAGGGGGDYPTITETLHEDTVTWVCDWEYSKIRNAVVSIDRSIAGIFIDAGPGSKGGSWSVESATKVVLTLADGSRYLYSSDGTITEEL